MYFYTAGSTINTLFMLLTLWTTFNLNNDVIHPIKFMLLILVMTIRKLCLYVNYEF